MTKRRAWIPLLALVLAVPAVAQKKPTPVVAFGLVGKLPSMSFCMDGAKYKLENSNLRMKDNPKAGVDASKFLGKWVRVEGYFRKGLNGPTCDRLDLVKIATTTEYLDEQGSNLAPGGLIDFTLYGKVSSLHALLMGAGKPARRMIPLGPLGLLVLDPQSPIFNLVALPIPSSGMKNLKLPIPNNPALKGMALTFQSAATSFKPTLAAYLLNPQAVQIQ
jgi:hypothetical protein